MTGHRYLHLDVFTDRALSGNPLAVFPDARGIDGALAFAWMRQPVPVFGPVFADQPGVAAALGL